MSELEVRLNGMKCSVLIPSYRRGPALLDCLQAVVSGNRLPDEIIVVLRDTDTDSHTMLDEWLASAPHAGLLRIAKVTERGMIAALNCGLQHVSGDVVVFTDDDAVPRAEWLARLMSHYDAPEVGGAGGRDVVHHGEKIWQCRARKVGRLTWYGKVISNHHCDYDGAATEVEHLKGVNMSFRRELLRPFDEGIWGRGAHFNDTDQSLTVSAAGYKLIYDPEAIVDHYPAARPDSASGRDLADPRQVYLHARDHCYLLLKHRPGWRMFCWLPYLTLIGSRRCPGLLIFVLQVFRFGLRPAVRFGAVISGISAALFKTPPPDDL